MTATQAETEGRLKAWRDEQQRQTEELCEALRSAIQAHSDKMMAEGRLPILNAVASAIVYEQAKILASVKGGPVRKALRKSMDQYVSRYLREMQVEKFSTVYQIDGPKT